MRIALVNPTWSFESSIAFGCRSAHLHLEFGACRVVPERAGREAPIVACAPDGLDLAGRPIRARRSVPFVQATPIRVAGDDPVPLAPRPSSPDHRRPRGEPDGGARRRSPAHHPGRFDRSRDIQSERPAPLRALEAACCPA